MRCIRVVLSIAVALLVAGSLGAEANALPGQSSDESVLVKGTKDVYVETSFPWKAYRKANGDVGVVYGPGAAAAHLPGLVLDQRPGSPDFYKKLASLNSTDTKPSAVKWYCEEHMVAPSRSGANLKSFVGMSCRGAGVPRGRIAWQFERNGWSFTGWRKYSNETHYTAYISGGTQGTDVYAHCNTRDGRTRSYTVYMRPQFEGLGWIGNWKRSPVGSKIACGYSEL